MPSLIKGPFSNYPKANSRPIKLNQSNLYPTIFSIITYKWTELKIHSEKIGKILLPLVFRQKTYNLLNSIILANQQCKFGNTINLKSIKSPFFINIEVDCPSQRGTYKINVTVGLDFGLMF